MILFKLIKKRKRNCYEYDVKIRRVSIWKKQQQNNG